MLKQNCKIVQKTIYFGINFLDSNRLKYIARRKFVDNLYLSRNFVKIVCYLFFQIAL